MSGPRLMTVLALSVMCVAPGQINIAQETVKSSESPAAPPVPPDVSKGGEPANSEQRASLEIGSIFPDQPPPWANSTRFGEASGEDFDEVPAITEAYATEADADIRADDAIRAAIDTYLFERTGYYQAARRIGLSSTDRSPPFVERTKEQTFQDNGESGRFKKAILLKVPHKTRDQWAGRWQHIKQQAAVAQTLFIGGGFLAAVTILAIHAKTNHATNGRRAGILRAAAAIAILTLFGGLTTAAVLGRIFSV